MTIVSSAIAEDHTQADGRRWVREEHTDHTGAKHYASYLALPTDDASAIMLERKVTIELQLAEQEIQANMDDILNG